MMQATQNVGEFDVLSSDYDVIVFCHLRWEFVLQRPQHIISRLAANRKVLFVEEPIEYSRKEEGTAKVIDGGENITVIQPRISWDSMIKHLVPIVKKYSKNLQLQNPILWFYSAAFSEIIPQLSHSCVVYDCMDELSAFKGASSSLIAMERNLLKTADVVFTGGKSLYEAKLPYSPAAYCFPSSVDRAHFEKTFKDEVEIPADIASIPHPITGFYGVIDERIDLELLDRTAALCPDMSFVMIGPVVKISEADLPRRTNIFYLGSKSYTELPAYLKAIDITSMPFALNEATRFISPTKTLEYMAADKPIISTAIYDVVRDYSEVVSIIKTPEEFANSLAYYITEPDEARFYRIALQQSIIEKNSWDTTVSQMKKCMAEALERRADQAEAGAGYSSLYQLKGAAKEL